MRGYVSAPDNSAVTINGIVAHIDDFGHFNLNDIPLAVGRNTITAVVTGIDGQTASQEITLESTGPAPFVVDASPTEGLGSLTVQFAITNPAHTPFNKIIVDLDGDGYPNLIATPNDVDNRSYTFTATYPEGTWTATITALDAANQPIFSTTRVIVVLMPELSRRATASRLQRHACAVARWQHRGGHSPRLRGPRTPNTKRSSRNLGRHFPATHRPGRGDRRDYRSASTSRNSASSAILPTARNGS